jgi:outer membrane lipoprotein-sorting protein
VTLREKRWVKDGKAVEGRKERTETLSATRGDGGWVLNHPTHGNYVRHKDAKVGKAEDLYRRMVAAVTKAETLDCAFELQVKGDAPASYRGVLTIAPGNKVRVELHALPPGKETHTIVSDGMALYVSGAIGPAGAPPKQLAEIVRGSFGRAGVSPTMFRSSTQERGGKDEKEVNLDDRFRASAFRLRDAEKVGTRAAEVVEHRMVTDLNPKETFVITVWIDAETHLPLKRVVTCEENGQPVTTTEIYSRMTVNGRIDPKTFEFPK